MFPRVFFEGEGGGGGGGGSTPETPPAETPQGKPEAKYTDDQVNAFKADAKREAVAQLLKEAGVESTGKLKEDLATLKKIQDAEKTEAQRLADANKETGEKLTAAEARALAAEIKAEAMILGVDPAKVERAAKLIPAYDGDNPKAKVEAFLKENPEFKSGSPTPVPPGAGGKTKNQGTPEAVKAAADVRAAMGLPPLNA